MATTAQLRNQAHDAADRLDWSAAADLWQQAIEAYPAHHEGSDLAKADIAMMQKFADRCRRQAGRK